METLTMVTMFELGVFLFGFLAGILISRLITRSRKDPGHNLCGELIVNTTDSDKDVLKFALDVPVVELMNADSVTFTVTREDT